VKVSTKLGENHWNLRDHVICKGKSSLRKFTTSFSSV